ncbi:MAG: endolytic transglycosylase MltG, partial [bacterium]|nr:endolytic transglycosylase MltG [bacterium]
RGVSAEIKAGTYEFSLPVAPAQLLRDPSSGRVKVYRVTIPEGFNLFQTAEALAAAGITGREGFLQAARDPGLLSDLKIPGSSAEGYLYPDTYYFARGINPELVMRKMAENFREVFAPLWNEAAPETRAYLTPERIVILASVIEKETADPAERPLIAAAFLNRLKKKMRLDSDPTVIYGIWDQFNGNLRRKDLEHPTPYNTYQIHGLPAGPIASPGRDSLWAVLHPAPVPYLYFVSRNDGTHQFSSTLTEHNRWVYKYQKAKAHQIKPKTKKTHS